MLLHTPRGTCLGNFEDRFMAQEGRAADHVLVSGNPTDSIEAIRDIKTVWRNGETAMKK